MERNFASYLDLTPDSFDAVASKNVLGEIDSYGDNAHVLPLRMIDENDSFHLGTFDAVCANFAAPSGLGSHFHSLAITRHTDENCHSWLGFSALG